MRMTSKIISKIVYLAFIFIITGCAFHFRDQHSAPQNINNICIQDQTDDRTGLVFSLRHNLSALGVNTCASSSLRLIILTNQFSQNTTTLGTAQQLNSQVINYVVSIVLKDKNNNDITLPITLNTSTSYWQNSNQILGDTAAIPALRQGLVRDMTQKILAYLSSTETQQAIITHGK